MFALNTILLIPNYYQQTTFRSKCGTLLYVFPKLRVFLLNKPYTEFTSVTYNDPPNDHSWARPCLIIDHVIRRLVKLSAVSGLAVLILIVLVSTWRQSTRTMKINRANLETAKNLTLRRITHTMAQL